MDALYRTYHRRVYWQCLRMLRNQADAEDMTQEVFLRVFKKANTFRGESRFSTWRHRLTFNLVLMELRKHSRRPVSSFSASTSPGLDAETAGTDEFERTLPSPSTSIFDQLSIQMALAQLPSGYRNIFVLHDVEGYKHQEIARIRGISTGTVKSQLHKARYRLRELLQDDRVPGPHGKLVSRIRHRARRCADPRTGIGLAAA